MILGFGCYVGFCYVVVFCFRLANDRLYCINSLFDAYFMLCYDYLLLISCLRICCLDCCNLLFAGWLVYCSVL